MMKRLTLLSVIILSCIAAKAQMARWVIHPDYDKIYMAEGAPLIVTDSLNTCALWDTYGRRLATTPDTVQAFHEGLALTTARGGNKVTGFYDTKGTFKPLNGYTTTFSYPYFSDGYVLLESEGKYRMVDRQGEEPNFGAYERIYPFSKGHAVCVTYRSLEKMKDPYYYYVTADKHLVQLSYGGKNIDSEDVKFLSSLSAGGTGVAIIKHKMFYYDSAAKTLKPVFPTADETNVKKQVQVSGDIDEWLNDKGDTLYIYVRKGKETLATFTFDRLARPLKADFGDHKVDFTRQVEAGKAYDTNFTSAQAADGKFSLTHKGKTTLPPQFESVGFSVGDMAAVRTKGKWGLLTVDDELRFSLRMNKGNDIGFRHRLFETVVRLDLPAVISASLCRFDVPQQYGCELDRTSVQTRNTENGNFVQYNCTLTIPDSLPDRMTTVVYPVQITYDGIRYPEYPLNVNAWHYKYINVNLDEEDIVVAKGNVAFNINIEVERVPGDSDYPFEVNVKTDSLKSQLEKLSETRYKCKVFSLVEGSNMIYINISERGLMPSVFPLEITYKKPVAKTEQVEIKKRVDSADSTEADSTAPAAAATATEEAPQTAPAAPAEAPAASDDTPGSSADPAGAAPAAEPES